MCYFGLLRQGLLLIIGTEKGDVVRRQGLGRGLNGMLGTLAWIEIRYM